ncbi:hypothetical protein [Gordonia sp. NPDC003950]
MDGEGCWSTVVSSTAERRALGLPDSAGWMLQCRLGIGHRGNHATDGGAHPRADRRYWLEWNDFDPHAQSLIERNPCPVTSPENAPCLYFHGHPGPHGFVRSNGHAPTALTGIAAAGAQGPSGGHHHASPGFPPSPAEPVHSGPSTGDLPVMAAGHSGAHRMPDHLVSGPADVSEPMVSGPTGSSEIDGLGAYRGGRRSTDSAPPDGLPPYQGRRHGFDEDPVVVTAGAASPIGAPDVQGADIPSTDIPSPDIPSTDIPSTDIPSTDIPSTGIPSTGIPSTGIPGTDSAGPSLDAVSDALSDVAAALSRLADALRRS